MVVKFRRGSNAEIFQAVKKYSKAILGVFIYRNYLRFIFSVLR